MRWLHLCPDDISVIRSSNASRRSKAERLRCSEQSLRIHANRSAPHVSPVPPSPSGLSIKYSTLIPGRSAAAAPRREERENILFFLSFNIYHVYFRERLLNRGQHGDYEARYILFNMFPSPWVFCLVSVSKKVWYGVQGVGRMAFRQTSHASVFHVFSRAAHNKRRNSSRYIYCLDIYLFNYLDKNVRVVLRRVRSLSV